MSDLISEKSCITCQTLKPLSDFKRHDTYRMYRIYKKCNECDKSERIALDKRYEMLNSLRVKKLEQKPKWRVVYYSFP